jgi:two-component system response regulator TrcR
MMQKHTLLLVDDEPHLARVIKDSLERAGYVVIHAADGEAGYEAFSRQSVDLCIVDVMLPRTDGFTLARQMRARHAQTPILFLTARTSTGDVVEGYESGGNDYLKKPFSLEELFLRIRELLKRGGGRAETDGSYPIGNYVFISHRQVLQFAGQADIKLSYRESQLLLLLCQRKNDLLDRKQALLTLWGDDSFFNTRTMDVFVTKLRKHLRNDPAVEIVNIRGIGYKLIG